MKITGIETFVVSNGFTPPRPWHFYAIRTDAGLTGYSEFGSDGITRGLVGLVQDLGQRLIGKDPTAVEKPYVDLYRVVRQAPYGATQQAIAGIELALWDLAGKALSVPVYKLMGGPHRESQWVYWSHLATYRANNWKLLGVKPLRSLHDLADVAREAPARGYTVFKTNIIWPGDAARGISQGRLGPHDQVATREIVKQAVAQIGAMRDAVGPDVGICLDINVNFKPSEAVRVGRALEPYDLFWLEIDNQDPHALAQLKSSVQAPICSGEQLQTIRQYRPYFELHAMDVVKVDVQWQGVSAAKKGAHLAEAAVYEEFNGRVNRGTAGIRAAFAPRSRGDYGKLRFHPEDLFVDATAGKALIRWLCTLETKRGPAAWRGLDILHVENSRIKEKLTYAKAKAPLFGEKS